MSVKANSQWRQLQKEAIRKETAQRIELIEAHLESTLLGNMEDVTPISTQFESTGTVDTLFTDTGRSPQLASTMPSQPFRVVSIFLGWSNLCQQARPEHLSSPTSTFKINGRPLSRDDQDRKMDTLLERKCTLATTDQKAEPPTYSFADPIPPSRATTPLEAKKKTEPIEIFPTDTMTSQLSEDEEMNGVSLNASTNERFSDSEPDSPIVMRKAEPGNLIIAEENDGIRFVFDRKGR